MTALAVVRVLISAVRLEVEPRDRLSQRRKGGASAAGATAVQGIGRALAPE